MSWCFIKLFLFLAGAVVVCVLMMNASIVPSSHLGFIQNSRMQVTLFRSSSRQSLKDYFFHEVVIIRQVQADGGNVQKLLNTQD